MKILVISDVHANIWAVQSILDQEKTYDLLLFAGDIVDYGIAPTESIEWLRSVPNLCAVAGNHDALAIQTYETQDYQNIPPSLFKWIHYDLQKMSADHIVYLKSLPQYNLVQADDWTYLITHSFNGTYYVPESRYQFTEFWQKHTPKKFWDVPNKRIVFGHTHRQCVHSLGNGMEWLNPGSASYRRPDDPDKTAHYAIIENGNITLKQTNYNRAPQEKEALRLWYEHGMMETEVQDFLFFFGNAPTSRSPLPDREG